MKPPLHHLHDCFVQSTRETAISLAVVFLACGCGASPANETRLNQLLSGSSESSESPLTLVPNGTVGNAYYYTSCQSNSAITSTAPTPDSGGSGEFEFSGTDYSDIAAIDGVFAIHECNSDSVYVNQLVEISWDVTAAEAANYSSLTLSWTGQVGVYSGTCIGGIPESILTSEPIQIYNGSTWVDLTTMPTDTVSTISQSFSTPSQYVVGDRIWMRVYAQASSFNCATVQTDSVSLELTP